MRRKTTSGHYIGNEFPSQRKLTENYSKLIRKIYSSKTLSARSKQKAVMALPGITRNEMEAIINTTGPELECFIRAMISPYKTQKKKNN